MPTYLRENGVWRAYLILGNKSTIAAAILDDFGHKNKNIIFSSMLKYILSLHFKLKLSNECDFIFAHETRIAIIMYIITIFIFMT